MGIIHHHAIVVTSWNDDTIKDAWAMANVIFPQVSPILPGVINGFTSFFIPPDGSNEGWEESDKGDRLRQYFIEYMDSLAYEDGSTALAWVEVGFGEYGSKVYRGSRLKNLMDGDDMEEE